MSFFRHEEIYRPMDNRNVPGRPWHHRPPSVPTSLRPF
jgi:hypothetical protein